MPLFEGSPTITEDGRRRSRARPRTLTRRPEARLRRVVADDRIADLLGINQGQEVGSITTNGQQQQVNPSQQLNLPDFYSDPRILDNLANTLSGQSFYNQQSSPLQNAIALQSVLAGLNTGSQRQQAGFGSGGDALVSQDGNVVLGGNGNAASILEAIGVQESGNNYNAVGPVNSGGRGTAKGKYQFIDSTWRYAARIAGVSTAEHPTALTDAQTQEQVAGAYADFLYKKYGSTRLVAIAWHAGEGAANAAARNGGRTSAYDSAAGISTNDYALSVARRAGG